MDTQTLVVIIIRNLQGDFFVHQRASYKKVYPNLYGLGAGGHMKDNETPDEGAQRELAEETSLISPVKKRFTIQHPLDNAPIHVYEISTAQEPKPCEDEWQWSGWMEPAQIEALIRTNQLCPDTAEIYKQYNSRSSFG